jgi:hypothetical protein
VLKCFFIDGEMDIPLDFLETIGHTCFEERNRFKTNGGSNGSETQDSRAGYREQE